MFDKFDIGKVTPLKKSALNIRRGDEVIRSFLKPVKAHTVLEIGTYKGIASLYMSQFCKKLYTIDLLEGKLETEGVPVHPNRVELWKMFDADNIIYLPAKCNNSKARIIKKIDFQFAFIDGEHTFEGVENDFELVKHCGKVLFHDYDKSVQEKRNGVYNFINTLPKEQITVRDIFAYWENK